ncbi:hypothetical protein V495_08863 [Pseudogymnoascus sp. VKM F-4514 (FW-929)]|nr:hypothetical protein V495_08863 [Pseudogymnoascus sp. VKM F-4514 (FW-929)]KFY60789.1 hypothetical protein V497_03387 [Pseudogymnoascus sp. VKM F-4516 (FW-969)]
MRYSISTGVFFSFVFASLLENVSAGEIIFADLPLVPNYAKAHGILMGLAFVVVLPSGAIFMRLLKSKGKATVWVHVGVQLVGWVLMISGLAMGTKVGKILDRLENNAHTIFGTVVVALMLLQPVFGYFHHRRFMATQKRGKLTLFHVWYGRILILLGMLNGGFGLKLAANSTGGEIAYGVVAGIIGATYLAVMVHFEITGGINNRAAWGKDWPYYNDATFRDGEVLAAEIQYRMSSEASPTRILLIIDVQRCLFDPRNPVPDSTRILHNLETVLARERAASPPTKVIWIRHNEDDDPEFRPNTEPWEIVQNDAFRIQENEVIVDKTTPDSFHKTSLASHIETAGFDPQTLQLVIIGMQSDFCVQTTARRAVARYPSARVSVVHGAHGTYDDESSGKSAEEVSAQIERELKKEGIIIEDLS